MAWYQEIIEVNGSRISRTEAEARQQPHWLYRLFDADGVLLYIGQTRNPKARFQNWFSKALNAPRFEWVHEAVRCDWHQYPDWWAVTAAEKQAIEVEGPAHNVYHQPLRVA